jgi:hypothetical protein
MISIYQLTYGKWKLFRYGCPNCEKNYKNLEYAEKHIVKCNINTNKRQQKERLKELKHMPIQKIINNGKPFYRWGDNGKLHINRKDAELEARAIYVNHDVQ